MDPQMETQSNQLELRKKELEKREAEMEEERRKIFIEKLLIDRRALEQNMADEKIAKLVEDQKRQKENLLVEMEKKIDAMQAFELEIQRNMQVGQLMEADEDNEARKKWDDIMKEKEEELEDLENVNRILTIKENNANRELIEAREELIKILKDQQILTQKKGKFQPKIGVKRMGDLDKELFGKSIDPNSKHGTMLISQWDDRLRDPNWHPFKVVEAEDDSCKEIIDEDDENLNYLKDQVGIDAYNAVVTALLEMNEYNPSGRYPESELWDFENQRRATLKEVISHLMTLMSTKRKKSRT